MRKSAVGITLDLFSQIGVDDCLFSMELIPSFKSDCDCERCKI